MIIALACIVVAGIAVNITNNIGSDVIRTANVHQRIRLDSAYVTVTGVRAGTAVAGITGDHYTSGGMVLAVTLRVEAPGTQYIIGGLDGGGVLLHAGGRTYPDFGPNSAFTVDAGFASTADLLYEVDPQHIAGAYLELFNDQSFSVTPLKVRIRLGITQQNAAQWVAAAKGRTLTVSEATSEPL